MKPFIAYLTLILLVAFTGTAISEESPDEMSPDDHPEEMGRTYYDDERTTVKEVYSYLEVQRFNPDKPQDGVQIEEVMHGPYFKYDQEGHLKRMGTYKEGKKHGSFRYYDENGNVIRTVQYEEGEKQEEVKED